MTGTPPVTQASQAIPPAIEHSDPLRGHACIRCKRSKRKCDGAKPSCNTCVKRNHSSDCKYETPEERRQARAQLLSGGGKGDKSSMHRFVDACIASNGRRERTALKRNDIEIPPEILLMDHSTDWWKNDELPTPIKDFLIATFISHAYQAHFEILVPHLLARLNRHPPSHSLYPHPALLSSMYLFAIFYLASASHPSRPKHHIKWNAREAEVFFLNRTRRYMSRNLSLVENLFDYLLATSILSRYLYYTTRQVEGHLEATGAMRFAMACNLHKITNPDVLEAFPKSILPPPTSNTEIYDRTNAFWGAFIMDRGGSVCVGMDVAVPDENIATVFPPSKDTASDAFVDDRPLHTVTGLYTPEIRAMDIRHDNMHIITAKYVASLEKVRQLVGIAAKNGTTGLQYASVTYRADFLATEAALLQFTSSLPPLRSISSNTKENATVIASDGALGELAVLNICIRASMIQLHGPFMRVDEESHEKVLKYAGEIVDTAEYLERINEIYWTIPVHKGWGNACEIFHREIHRIIDSGATNSETRDVVKKLRRDMGYLRGLMQRFLNVYDTYGDSLAFIEGLLAKVEHF